MTGQDRDGVHPKPLNERDVVRFLLAHPDFLSTHPELLVKLTVQHDTGAAVSLIERQVALLRERNRQLEKRLIELVDIARAHERFNERLEGLMLALTETNVLGQAYIVLHRRLVDDFSFDAVALRMFSGEPNPTPHAEVFIHPDSQEAKRFLGMLRHGKPVLNRPGTEDMRMLFPEQASDIQSVALIPLGNKRIRGFLAIASCQPERFRPGLGTLFLERMGAVVWCVLKSYMSSS
jgi:uncharacterized protein YigA (DUF484 family)